MYKFNSFGVGLFLIKRNDNMATKSILNSNNIKDKATARNFVNALERAEKVQIKTVTVSKPVERVERSEIKDFFKNRNK